MPKEPLTYILGGVLVLMLAGFFIAEVRGYLTPNDIDLTDFTQADDTEEDEG